MIKPILTLVAFIALQGCGSESDQGVYLDSYYQEKAGDVIRYQDQLEAKYSTGQVLNKSELEENYYTTVNNLPEKYNYNGDLVGPYLLRTNFEDSVLDGYSYQTLSGQHIIDDNLDYFDSAEFNTSQGSDEPENVQIGDKFSYTSQDVLFDSETAVEAGYSSISMDISIIGHEQVSVIAGSFDTIKISHSSTINSETDITVSSQSNGYMWVDSATGQLIKLSLIGSADYVRSNGFDFSASLTAESELHSMQLSSPSENSIQTRSIKINPVHKTISSRSIITLINANLPVIPL